MSKYLKEIEVRWSDIDANNHLRHSAYADFATHSRVEWLKQHGFCIRTLAELKLGVVIFSESTQYLKEVYLSERVRIDLEAVGLSEGCERWHFRQKFYKENGDLAAIYEVKGAWFDAVNRCLSAVPENMVEISQNLQKADDFAIIESKK